MVIGAVIYKNPRSKKRNLKAIEAAKGCFYGTDYEIFDLESLLREVNSMASRFKTPQTPLAISKTAWISYCCLNYVFSHLAYCDQVLVLDNCFDCQVATQVALMARLLGVSFLFFETKDGETYLAGDANFETKLPFVNYSEFIKNSEELQDEEFLGSSFSSKVETPMSDPGISQWFKAQFKPQK